VIAATLTALLLAATSGAPILPVSAAAGCAAAPTRAELVAGTAACTITAAGRVALPGDTVSVAAGTYPQARILASGSDTAPIVFEAAPGTVVVDAGTGGTALGIMGAHDIQVAGLDLRGGRSSTVWVSGSQRITLAGSQNVVIDSSTISGNRSTGIMETGSDASDVFSNDVVSGNGTGGPQYLGSGIEVGGSGTQIVGCTITDNGLSKFYEHGVYVASVATGWTITGSTITGSSGADVKAAGANGTIVSSTLGSARLGVYATGQGLTISQVHVSGSFVTGLVVAGGTTLLSHSVVSNDGHGYGKSARAARVYGGGKLKMDASKLLLRGVQVGPPRP
jgi:hypothetical protein